MDTHRLMTGRRGGWAALAAIALTLALRAPAAALECPPCYQEGTVCSGGVVAICYPGCVVTPGSPVCRPSTGACDPAERCELHIDGLDISASCPADVRSPAGTVCRASAGACDVAETCDGTSAACPADAFVSAGTTCRASAGICDVAEACTGSSADCPADALAPAGTVCRGKTGVCDVAETCSGTSAACPTNKYASAGTVCRAASGACDVAETCTGSTSSCPSDRFQAAGTVCRAAAGDCDVAESCSGTAAACPADAFVAAGTACRSSAGACDVAESCTGSAATCPADARVAAGTVCRAAAGACDVAEACDGTTAACPADAYATAAVVCRPAAGECDAAEHCSGADVACPADAAAPAGAPCTDDGDACTLDACDGGGACAHAPAADGDADGQCDAIDPCTNPGGARDFASGTKLGFTHVDADAHAGDDGFGLAGSFDLADGYVFADLHPDATGVRVLVTAADGTPRLDATLPGGLYAGKGTRGWKAASNGRSWTYLDKTATPPGGIVKVRLSDQAKAATPGRTKLAVSGKNGVYPVAASDAPLTAVVTLGAPEAGASGLCAETAYVATDCTTNGAHTAVACKR